MTGLSFARLAGVFLLLAYICVGLGRGQEHPGKVVVLSPVPMPADRTEESYRIYSQLISGREFLGSGGPREPWLIADTTLTQIQTMDPRTAIKPPDARLKEFKELLDDYDRHCNERIHLTHDALKLPKSFFLLNEAQQHEFAQYQELRHVLSNDALALVAANAAEYKGASGIGSFSQVYFNKHHTLAMVYKAWSCGQLCGQYSWNVFELQNGVWKQLRWVRIFAVS